MADRARLTVRELAVFALLGALLFAAKMAMAALPNIEPVTLLVLVYSAVYGRKALFPVYIYVALELLVWGFSLWVVNYLYIWLFPAVCGWLFQKNDAPLFWAVLSGGFGLLFGALCAPVYLVSGGWAFALSWWVQGLPFDLLHCAGNFALALLLFCPLRALLTRLRDK